MKVRSLTAFILTLVFLLIGPFAVAEQHREETPEEVQLIEGLDGGEYEPYKPSVVEKVQAELKTEGFYTGETDGVLDQETMQAIGDFQEERDIQVSGVPSPETREALGMQA